MPKPFAQLVSVILALTTWLAPCAAQATYPDKPVRIIVPFSPGGGTDLVAKSAPDGYTLLIATFANAVNPSLLPKLPYASDTAFAPIVLIGRSPNVLVVRAEEARWMEPQFPALRNAGRQPSNISPVRLG